MQTLLRSETKELSIDTNGPVTMIGGENQSYRTEKTQPPD